MLPRHQPARALTCACAALINALILLGVGIAWAGAAGLVIAGFLTLGTWTLLAAAATAPGPQNSAPDAPVLRRPQK